MGGIRWGGGSPGPGARGFGRVQIRDRILNYGAKTGTDQSSGEILSAVRATADSRAELAGDPKRKG